MGRQITKEEARALVSLIEKNGVEFSRVRECYRDEGIHTSILAGFLKEMGVELQQVATMASTIHRYLGDALSEGYSTIGQDMVAVNIKALKEFAKGAVAEPVLAGAVAGNEVRVSRLIRP